MALLVRLTELLLHPVAPRPTSLRGLETLAKPPPQGKAVMAEAERGTPAKTLLLLQNLLPLENLVGTPAPIITTLANITARRTKLRHPPQQPLMRRLLLDQIAMGQVVTHRVVVGQVVILPVVVDRAVMDQVVILRVVVDRAVMDLVAMDPVLVDRAVTDLVAMDPVVVDRAVTDLVAMDPVVVDRAVINLVAMDPVVVHPVVMDLVAIHRVVMDPVVVHLVVTHRAVMPSSVTATSPKLNLELAWMASSLVCVQSSISRLFVEPYRFYADNFGISASQEFSIIADFVCNILENNCEANDVAKQLCAQAASDAKSVEDSTGKPADVFNGWFGQKTNYHRSPISYSS
jgi:hypothetical protein